MSEVRQVGLILILSVWLWGFINVLITGAATDRIEKRLKEISERLLIKPD